MPIEDIPLVKQEAIKVTEKAEQHKIKNLAGKINVKASEGFAKSGLYCASLFGGVQFIGGTPIVLIANTISYLTDNPPLITITDLGKTFALAAALGGLYGIAKRVSFLQNHKKPQNVS